MAASQSSLAKGTSPLPQIIIQGTQVRTRRQCVIENPYTPPLTPLSHSPIPAGTTLSLPPGNTDHQRRHSSVYRTYSSPTADRHYLDIPSRRERRMSIPRPIRGINSTIMDEIKKETVVTPRKRRASVASPGFSGRQTDPLSSFRDQTVDDKFTAWVLRNKMTRSVTDPELGEDDRLSDYGVTV